VLFLTYPLPDFGKTLGKIAIAQPLHHHARK